MLSFIFLIANSHSHTAFSSSISYQCFVMQRCTADVDLAVNRWEGRSHQCTWAKHSLSSELKSERLLILFLCTFVP